MLRRSFTLFCKNVAKIHIESVDEINLTAIDQRIKRIGWWNPRFPTSIDLSVPTECADEIIEKLKAHKKITKIDGEFTPHGEEVRAALFEQSEGQFRK